MARGRARARCALLALASAGCGAHDGLDARLHALRAGDAAAARLDELGPADADAVPRLASLLRADRRRFVQTALIDALVSIGSADALPALAGSIAHPDDEVRFRAAAAHARLSGAVEPGVVVLLEGVRAGDGAALRAWRTVAGGVPREVVDTLVAEAAASPSAALLEAVAAAGPRARAIEPTLRAVVAERAAHDPGTRAAAAWALARAAGDPATAAVHLVAIWRTATPFLRRTVGPRLLALGAEHPGEVVPRLATVLRDPDPGLRAAAAWMLGELGASARGALAELRAVAASDPSAATRAAARAAAERVAAGDA